MKKLTLFTALLMCSSAAIALLPPYYQSAKEITTIMNDPEIAKKIGSGRLIHVITKTETGYTLEAGECTLTVNIVYKPQPEGLVGPAIFEVQAGDLVCKQPIPQTNSS